MKTRFVPQAAAVFDAVIGPFLSTRIAKLHVQGPSNPLPSGMPLLLVANHVSWWDGFLLRALQKRLRPTAPLHTVMLERELAKNPWFRLMGCHGLVPGDRSSWEGILAALACEVAANPDTCLSFFPQGRIWPSQRRPLGFRRGIEQLIPRLPDPLVVPVAIRFEPLNTLSPHVFLRVGEPVRSPTGELAGAKHWERVVQALLDEQAAQLDRLGEDARNGAMDSPVPTP